MYIGYIFNNPPNLTLIRRFDPSLTSGDQVMINTDSGTVKKFQSFKVHQVGLNHHFRRPEVKTGTSGYDRLVKMSKSKSTSSIYPLQYDLGILNYYICN